jgi:hypothetical protein
MNKKAYFTVISLILVLAVLGFGVYMTLQPFLKNKFEFILSGANLDFSIEANAHWATGDSKNFRTETDSNGLVQNYWIVPDIVFSANEGSEATLSLTVVNKNLEKGIRVGVSGIAFDSDPLYKENPRFVSSLIFDDGINPAQSTTINTEGQTLYKSILPSESEDEPRSLTITFKYELLSEEFDFTFTQNIVIVFETV